MRIIKGSLRHKLYFLLILVTLGIVVMGSFLGYYFGHKLLYDSVDDNHRQMAKIAAKYVSQMVFEDLNWMESYVGSIFWRGLIIRANSRYEKMTDKQREQFFMDMDKKWAALDRGSPEIKEYLDNDVSIRLRGLVKTEFHTAEVFITDKFGGLVASSAKTTDFYQGDELWWKEAFAAGKGNLFIDDIAFDESSGQWSMVFALPIKYETGEVFGVCKFVYKTSSLFGPLGEIRIGRTGHIAVVDKNGYIVFHEGIEPLSVKYCSDENFRKLLKSKDKGAVLFFPYHKEKMMVGFTEIDQPLLKKRGIEWTLFVSQEQKEIFGPFRNIVLGQIGINLILLLLFIIPVGFIFTKIFIAPIAELDKATQEAERGNLDQTIELKTGDEIEGLAVAFNNMIKGIRDRRDQLRQYAKDLERSNRELEMFADIASHDLREPLRMVTSYLQLLERQYKGRLGKDADEFIDYAVEGAVNMRNLIDDLLVYSRAGRQVKEPAYANCEDIFTAVTNNLKLTIEESKVMLTHDPLPVVMADEGQLIQLLQNLIDNAIKFRNPKERPFVHVSAKREINEWVFSVRDNGIGIEEEYFEQIFQVFQRLHSKKQYPGSGIGLAICRKIVERMGGRIWVESQAGKGSIFFFTIPENRSIT